MQSIAVQRSRTHMVRYNMRLSDSLSNWRSLHLERNNSHHAPQIGMHCRLYVCGMRLGWLVLGDVGRSACDHRKGETNQSVSSGRQAL